MEILKKVYMYSFNPTPLIFLVVEFFMLWEQLGLSIGVIKIIRLLFSIEHRTNLYWLVFSRICHPSKTCIVFSILRVKFKEK
jgi:hypothetical protein